MIWIRAVIDAIIGVRRVFAGNFEHKLSIVSLLDLTYLDRDNSRHRDPDHHNCNNSVCGSFWAVDCCVVGSLHGSTVAAVVAAAVAVDCAAIRES